MKVGVIADDLTGANATGIKLCSQGLVSSTIFHDTPISHTDEADVICIDTDSRYASTNTSRHRVRDATLKLKKWGSLLLCKRIDSTVRGNIGSEIDAMLEIIDDRSVAIITPSYPASGRIVVGGYLLVNNELVQDTDVANDPIQPLEGSYVPHLLQKQSMHQIALIDSSTITQGAKQIESKIRDLTSQGTRLIVCDAVTEDHIKSIARAMSMIKNTPFIPVDPGPLTNYYVANKQGIDRDSDKSKILFTVGSVTSVTNDQLRCLKENVNVRTITIDPDKLATMESGWQQEVSGAVNEVKKVPIKEPIILVTTNHPKHTLVDLKKRSKDEGVPVDVLAKKITEGLAEVSKQVIVQYKEKIKGCFFSGGDVTASFCQATDVNGISLKGEVMPLVAYGRLMGGDFNKLPIVTKGGMIGGNKTMVESYEYLRSMIERECINQ